ncbi:MAG: MarR family transcriptional regulator [Leptospiraceae bacterium]|nr:MarR family transcriptional regulator [Leptospiraceae bacterium]
MAVIVKPRHGIKKDTLERTDAMIGLAQEVYRLYYAFKAAEKRAYKDGLNDSMRELLFLLMEKGHHTVPALARIRGVSRQRMQSVADGMIQLGFLEKAPNPAHRKSAILQLTKKGRGAAGRSLRTERRFFQNMMPWISERKLVSARSLLAELRETLERR